MFDRFLAPDSSEEAMTTAPNPLPDVTLPPGAKPQEDEWWSDDPQPYRVIVTVGRPITDHRLTVWSSAVQWANGTVDDGRIEAPHVNVYDLGEGYPLNSDQARELAAVLLEEAARVDGWAGK